ncbi:unnamed protein product [Arctogadus glacialis]
MCVKQIEQKQWLHQQEPAQICRRDYINTEKDALAERIREHDHVKDATSAIVEQYSGPEFSEIKKKLETPKESNSELKDTFLLFTEVTDNKLELIQRAIEGIKD